MGEDREQGLTLRLATAADAAAIADLAVHPAQRRRGIARMLMVEAEREARRRGLGRMHLGVRLALQDNRRLFLSCGFVEAEFLSHEGFSEPTWVRMERELD